MIRSRGIANARPVETPVIQAAAWTALVLIAGFLILQTPPAIVAFAGVAQMLAISAEPLLSLLGYNIVRTGVELRDTLSGHAIAVTSSCDGSGLLLSAAACLTWFRIRGAPMRAWPYVIALAVGSIFAFNLIRVLAIFSLIGTPVVMQAVHLYAAPLLSAVLVAGMVLYACRFSKPKRLILPALWLAVGLAVAVLWYVVGYSVTCATALPIANGLLSLLPDLLIDSLACGPSSAVLITSGATSLQPPSVLNVPFYPADFTLALPLVAASLACLRRAKRIIRGALASLAAFAVAMALAALTIGNDQAMASGITRLIGRNFIAPYEPPNALILAMLKTLQNTVVHFNLFLLPLLLLRPDRSPGDAQSKSRRGRTTS